MAPAFRFYRYLRRLPPTLACTLSLVVAAGGHATCKSGQPTFTDSWYLIQPEQIGAVANFFATMGENHFISDIDFSSIPGSQTTHITYFDYPEQNLLHSGREISMQHIQSLPDYRQERNTIIYRDRSTPESTYREIPYQEYNRRTAAMDRHPLWSKVRRKDRESLAGTLGIAGSDVLGLHKSIDITRRDMSYLTSHYGNRVAVTHLSSFEVHVYGRKNTLTVFSMQLLPDARKKLAAQELATLHSIYCSTEAALATTLPSLQAISEPGYREFDALANELLPTRPVLQQYPVIYAIGQIVALSIIGALLLFLLLGRYQRVQRTNTTKRKDVIFKHEQH